MYFWLNRDQKSGSLNQMYKAVGITKQGFAKNRKRQLVHKEEERYVIEIVNQVRVNHPTMNCRSIYYKMNPVFIGRDRFEAICKEAGLNVVKYKNKKRTTDSTGVKRFPNLLKDHKELTRIDEVWSSDITYYEVNNIFYYITFIIDNYSRRIVGHHISNRLLTRHTTLPALQMAIKTRGKELRPGIIMHSDGGGQYYAEDFLELTKRYNFKNSMCKYAWENGKAERINGTIKNNYLRHWSIDSVKDLVKQVDRAVHLYNTDKPHKSLCRMTPIDFEKKLATLATMTRPTSKNAILN